MGTRDQLLRGSPAAGPAPRPPAAGLLPTPRKLAAAPVLPKKVQACHWDRTAAAYVLIDVATASWVRPAGGRTERVGLGGPTQMGHLSR